MPSICRWIDGALKILEEKICFSLNVVKALLMPFLKIKFIHIIIVKEPFLEPDFQSNIMSDRTSWSTIWCWLFSFEIAVLRRVLPHTSCCFAGHQVFGAFDTMWSWDDCSYVDPTHDRSPRRIAPGKNSPRLTIQTLGHGWILGKEICRRHSSDSQASHGARPKRTH